MNKMASLIKKNIYLNPWRIMKKFNYLYYKEICAKHILYSNPIHCKSPDPLEVHMLTGEKAVIESMWCLKTFYKFIDLSLRLVIHDDGTLSNKSISIFYNHFKGVKIIKKDEADKKIITNLKGYDYSMKYRIDNYMPHSIKLIDFFYFSKNSFLALDSDVLFFKKPMEVLRFLEEGKGFYMSDYRNSYSLSREDLGSHYNFEILPRINTGLFFVPSEMIYDKLAIEDSLKLCYENNYPMKQWTEQTVFAVIFSKYKENFKGYQITIKFLGLQSRMKPFLITSSMMDQEPFFILME